MSPSRERSGSYEKKRDFRKTPEPRRKKARFHWARERPVFVIQKHDASRLHYDFRLEVDGVLKSWAVPKGPSTDPRERRLAVPTEDHPLSYADFEGIIPEEEYGGGTVMVWDRGSYRNLKEEGEEKDSPSVSKQIDEGHVTVRLEGEKLSGGYVLIRTGGGDDRRWLLIKMDDEDADARKSPVSTGNRSVKSGRTMKEIRDQETGHG